MFNTFTVCWYCGVESIWKWINSDLFVHWYETCLKWPVWHSPTSDLLNQVWLYNYKACYGLILIKHLRLFCLRLEWHNVIGQNFKSFHIIAIMINTSINWEWKINDSNIVAPQSNNFITSENWSPIKVIPSKYLSKKKTYLSIVLKLYMKES